MERGFSVLTVCTGNVHRSPLAATMLGLWADWYLPTDLSRRVDVASAGTNAAVGARMSGRVSRIARVLGGDGAAHRARQITDADIAAADLVLAATRSHRDDVLGRVPSALRRTFTIREAGRIADHLARGPGSAGLAGLTDIVAAMADARGSTGAPTEDDDIIDPQGLQDDAYLRMAGEEIPPLAALAELLFGMPRADHDAYLVAVRDLDLDGRDL